MRQQAKGGLASQPRPSGLAAGYSYGWESDYRSHTRLGVGHAISSTTTSRSPLATPTTSTSVCDANNPTHREPLDLQPLAQSAHCFRASWPTSSTHKLSIDTFEPSLIWTATPRLVVQGGSTIQILDGFQSNPYRGVLVGSQHRTPQEHVPNFRQRYAVFGRGAYALPDVRASLTGGIRLYRDSWAVQAVTAELNSTSTSCRTSGHAARPLSPADRRQLLPQLARST